MPASAIMASTDCCSCMLCAMNASRHWGAEAGGLPLPCAALLPPARWASGCRAALRCPCLPAAGGVENSELPCCAALLQVGLPEEPVPVAAFSLTASESAVLVHGVRLAAGRSSRCLD